MNFLLDENIPPSLASVLLKWEHRAVHVREVNLLAKADELIFDFAAANEMIIITHDLDFGRIHAYRSQRKPSVILFRIEPISLKMLIDILQANLEELKKDLEDGAIVVVEEGQIRIRQLPIKLS